MDTVTVASAWRGRGNILLDYLSDGYDAFDPWGSAMGAAFALCDWVTFRRSDLSVPDGMEFRPSPLGPATEAWEWEAIEECVSSETVTDETFTDALAFLDAFLIDCRRGGLEY